jgi:hypothetical protein
MSKKDDIATHEEALRLLTAKARAGSVHATVALAREIRAAEKRQFEVDEVIDRILGEGSASE